MRKRTAKIKTGDERIAALEKHYAQRKVQQMMAAAERNCPVANYWLALAYTGGLGSESAQPDLPLDAGKGVAHLRVCLRRRHAEGILRLAAMCASTAPVPGYDPQKAAELTEEAAMCGSYVARAILNECRYHDGNLELLLSKSVQLAWPGVARSLPLFPESGFAAHPAISKQFNLERSGWRTQRHKPARRGTYEMLINGKIVYAHWNEHSWTSEGRAVPSKAKWRGLAYDPDMPCVTYIDPPAALLPGVAIGGYVENYDPSSPRVRLIHVAKPFRSKDGELLTMCGHMSRSRTPLRLWCDTPAIKMVDGYQPELCTVCASRTFRKTSAVGVEPASESVAAPNSHEQPGQDSAQEPAIEHVASHSSPDQPVPRPAAAKGAPTRPIRFAGGIGYENYHTGSTAKTFELLDKDRVAVELISRVDEPGMPSSVLDAIAYRVGPRAFYRTGMVPLTTPNGEPHPYNRAELSFTIVHLDQDIIRIEGGWKDENGATYPFISILQRIAEPLA